MLLKTFEEYEKITTKKDRVKYLNDAFFMHIIEGTLNSAIISGLIYVTHGKYEDALCLFNHKSIRDRPESSLGKALVYLSLAKQYYKANLCTKAVEELNNISKESNNCSTSWLITFKKAEADYQYGRITRDYRLVNNSLIVMNRLSKLGFPQIWNEIGNIYITLHDYDNAKIAFNNSINSDETGNFASPYNGLGNICRKSGRYLEAINHYRKALRIDDKFFYPKYYLGDCYRLLEKHDEAIDCYRATIEINPNHVFPWYGLGRAYYEKGNRDNKNYQYYKKAISCLKKAINLNPEFPYAILDYARVLEKTDELNKSLKYYEIAKKTFEQIKLQKDSIKNEIRVVKLNINIKQTLTKTQNDPVTQVLVKSVQQGIEQRARYYEKIFSETFLSTNQPKNSSDSYLEVLRRWNSYTPIVTDGSKGGGYFLSIKAYDGKSSKGIVIDPGFHFIQNFKNSNHKFNEIDTVFISHAHDDHTADLESILNLLQRYNKRLKETVIPRSIAKKETSSTRTVIKSDMEKINAEYVKRKKVIKLYISEGTYQKYSSFFLQDEKCEIIGAKEAITDDEKFNVQYLVTRLEAGMTLTREELGFELSIRPIKAFHNDLIKDKQCLGFVIYLDKTIIIYTGDTAYKGDVPQEYETIHENFKKLRQDSNSRFPYVVLLAHLGSFKEKEMQYLLDKSDPEKYLYESHLGRIGLTQMCDKLEPNLCLISEFGEEFRGQRTTITKIFQQALDKTVFLPADIGLQFNLSKHKVRVITKIDTLLQTIFYREVPPKMVNYGEVQITNSIFYYEHHYNGKNHQKNDVSNYEIIGGHIPTENQCSQALFEGYNNEEYPVKKSKRKVLKDETSRISKYFKRPKWDI